MSLKVVILAAGQGTRMKSKLPKVLHPIGGKPLLRHVVDTAKQCQPEQIIIVHSPDPSLLKAAIPDPEVTWALQPEQRGTGDAVAKALPLLQPSDQVLILYSDVPLISVSTLQRLLQHSSPDQIALLTTDVADPTGFGRIVRNADQAVERIVEERDITATERAITEINTGILTLSAAHLKEWLTQLKPNNAQNELLLTDIIAMAVQKGVAIQTISPHSSQEVMGINDRVQLAQLNRIYQQQRAEHYLRSGVGIVDPASFQLRGTLQAEQDAIIDVNVVLEGNVVLRRGAQIGPNCVIKDCEIGEDAQILANSYCEGAVIGAQAVIGPFARLRPGTILAEKVRIGNFVEVKNAQIDVGSKINHLSYIGDATIGKHVNIGAGTITCNYDGVNKHRTIIEDGVHIGSDTQLIAPVRVGKDAVIAAGSTLKQDAPGKSSDCNASAGTTQPCT